MSKLFFHNPLLRSSSSSAAAAPPRLSEISQTRSLSQMMGGIITTNPSQMWVHAGAAAAATSRSYSTKSVRPLSPHLSVYKPQTSSMGSIFHRISFMYLTGLTIFYYLVYIKMAPICLTFDAFNWALYYTSKLTSLLNELAGVAMLYYVYHGVHGLFQFRSGGIGLPKLLRFGKK